MLSYVLFRFIFLEHSHFVIINSLLVLHDIFNVFRLSIEFSGIGKISVEEDSSSCVFSQTLEHWRDLNLTTRHEQRIKKQMK